MLQSIQNINFIKRFNQSEQLKQESMAIIKMAACDDLERFDIRLF